LTLLYYLSVGKQRTVSLPI